MSELLLAKEQSPELLRHLLLREQDLRIRRLSKTRELCQACDQLCKVRFGTEFVFCHADRHHVIYALDSQGNEYIVRLCKPCHQEITTINTIAANQLQPKRKLTDDERIALWFEWCKTKPKLAEVLICPSN